MVFGEWSAELYVSRRKKIDEFDGPTAKIQPDTPHGGGPQ